MTPTLRITILVFYLSSSFFSFASFGTDPFWDLADDTATCSQDGTRTSIFNLCNTDDSRPFQVNDSDVLSIEWQKLQDDDCSFAGQDCINRAISCNWTTLSTDTTFNVDAIGDYRVILNNRDFSKEFFYARFNLLIRDSSLEIIQNISVSGGNDGEIQALVQGDSDRFLYGLENLSTGEYFAQQLSPRFTGLSEGNYRVNIESDINCFVTTNTVILSDPTTIEAQLIQRVDFDCAGSNAELEVSATGGNPPYQYSIDGGNTFTTNTTFWVSDPGTYRALVRDSNGETALSNGVYPTEPALITATFDAQDVSSSGGSDGSITVTASGGSNGFWYRVNGGAFQASPVFSNLSADTYYVIVQDDRGCFIESVIEILEPATTELALTAEIQNHIACNTNARILLTPSGGTPPYEFSSRGSSYRTTNPFVTGSAGETTFTVRDATGATAISNQVLIEANDNVVSANVSMFPGDCTGQQKPRVVINLTEGTGNIQYSLYPGIWQDSDTFLDVPEGTYNAYVKNDECTFGMSINVHKTVAMSAYVAEQNEGYVKIQIIGGVAPYHYQVNQRSAPRQSIGNETTFELFDLSPGPHYIFVSDSKSCEEIIGLDIEGEIPELTFTAEKTNVSCHGSEDGAIDVIANGGTGNYSWFLREVDQNIYHDLHPETSRFDNLPPGTYMVHLRDTRTGRQVRSEPMTISEPELFEATIASSSGAVEITNTGTARLSILGGKAPYEYALDGYPDYWPLTNASIRDLSAGYHTASIRDANGCETQLSFEIEEVLWPEVSISFGDASCSDSVTEVTISVSEQMENYSFSLNSWDIDTAQNSNVFTDLTVGYHSVTIFRDGYFLEDLNFTIDQAIPLLFFGEELFNDGDGLDTVFLTAEGGQAPYLYSNDGVNFSENDVFENLTPGSYTYHVKDAKGCTEQTSVVIAPKNASEENEEMDAPQGVDEDGAEQDVPDTTEEDSTQDDTEKEPLATVYQNQGPTEVITLVWDEKMQSSASISIFNGKGNLVFSDTSKPGSNQTELNVANLSRGIYFIYISSPQGEEVKKVLIL